MSEKQVQICDYCRKERVTSQSPPLFGGRLHCAEHNWGTIVLPERCYREYDICSMDCLDKLIREKAEIDGKKETTNSSFSGT